MLKSTSSALEMKAYIRKHKLNSTSLPSKDRILLSHNYVTMRKKLFAKGHIGNPAAGKKTTERARKPGKKTTARYDLKYGTGKDEV
tara:strand:- start:549 stop:806 length:258 start_codon:yes stop_codon:yes gene_type:complete